LSRDNTEAEVDQAVKLVVQAVDRVRQSMPAA
jgi:cysteine sulfinate desulfinase/cysteine desulfurase-like protein